MGKWVGSLTAEEFVAKWSRAGQLSERAASHEHFIDLCHILGQPTPAEADATGEDYCFEKHVKVVRSASKGSKGDYGFVDVWKRGYFAWEYKGTGAGQPLPADHPLFAKRAEIDQKVLANLLRLNHARAKGNSVAVGVEVDEESPRSPAKKPKSS